MTCTCVIGSFCFLQVIIVRGTWFESTRNSAPWPPWPPWPRVRCPGSKLYDDFNYRFRWVDYRAGLFFYHRRRSWLFWAHHSLIVTFFSSSTQSLIEVPTSGESCYMSFTHVHRVHLGSFKNSFPVGISIDFQSFYHRHRYLPPGHSSAVQNWDLMR